VSKYLRVSFKTLSAALISWNIMDFVENVLDIKLWWGFEQWETTEKISLVKNARAYKDTALLLPNSKNIRLVKILPGQWSRKIRLKIFIGDWKTSKYEALSYVWGSQLSGRAIRAGGSKFTITKNLYDACTTCVMRRVGSL
jgi:Heterokaryon incompatibility protein (HET)